MSLDELSVRFQTNAEDGLKSMEVCSLHIDPN